MSARSQEQQVGDERIQAATGRSRAEWYALLDEAGATEWDHGHIARWLGGEHDVDAWWAQSVTVGYEQARGLRLPGQRTDGSYEATATKTLYTSPEELWPLLSEEGPRSDWLDVDFHLVGMTEPRSVRLEADDGSRVVLLVDRIPPGRDGREKVRLAVQHTRLPGAHAVPDTKEFWRARLAELAGLVNAH